MNLFKFLRKIKRGFLNYEPSIKIFISRDRLVGNLREYQSKYPKLSFAPVLKSNAYGHGLVLVAEILDGEKVPFLVVDALPEATILRNNSIKSNILVIGHTKPENIKNSRLSLISFTITSLDQLEKLSEIVSGKINIHLKVDTGMHRQGIVLKEMEKAVKIIKSNKFLNLEGVCSHFADADGPEEVFTNSQIEKWNEIVSIFNKEFVSIKYFHVSATSGLSFSEKVSSNVVRLGLGLYGFNSSSRNDLDLEPALEMQSVITSLRKINKGEKVGYNITYEAKEDSMVATVSGGYFEGVDRRLSNCGVFKIGDVYCPIVGRVSMNMTSVDVGAVPNVKFGDKVVVISKNRGDKNSVENITKLTGTIPWEILVHIPQHLRREGV